ncbi:uncharacterized protein LOC124659999 [Lolium rigidum]|uniref:uncharacterized protein LOC124659999 n=1 Tax=Lolium rigidum TaxID=89674 RepID=UPI001F5E0037|nr:uncharacterized protein LOC124659999 [Lolium rigidum]
MVSPPPLKNPTYLCTYHICFLVLVSTTTTLSAAVSTSSYSSVCPSVAPASDHHTDVDDALSLARSFQIYDGYFSGGADSLFSHDDQLHNNYRSFSLFPDSASCTSDLALVHVVATLTLTGPRSIKYMSHGRRRNHTFAQSISFVLDGYYSSTSLQLCMVGTGTELAANGSSLKQYLDVTLHLHVPSPSSLTDPFVTGTLDGSSDFAAIQLLAYAEGEGYRYGERATCSAPVQQPATGLLQALEGNFACEALRETSYRLLDHRGGGPAMLRRMHVNRMQCGADGAVRAYMVLSNDTGSGRRGYRGRGYYHHMVNDEAMVAEGHWDSDRRMLCLRACRVVRSQPSTLAVLECGIGMSFWFPAVWTVLERSTVAGVLWSSGVNIGAGPISGGVISAFSFDDHRRNLSDVTYSYNDTMLEVAKKHYYLNISKRKRKGSFPAQGNYAYHDFRLQFYMKNAGTGDAYPVTMGSVMLNEDGFVADDSSSSRPAVVGNLLNVSYYIHIYAHQPENRVNMSRSYTLEEGRISAEGVYDPKRGILSMVGCQEHSGSTDCEILITMQFAALGDRAEGFGSRGTIRSLRDRADGLFFEKMDITLYGMYPMEVSEAISRMDLESVMLVISSTLSCIFTILQILHTKRNPKTALAMSITMLAILALGHLAPLVLSFEVMFRSRRSQYSLYLMDSWLEVNQVMMRVPTLIAFLLQLRLLQLALFGRLRSAGHQSKSVGTQSVAVSERIVLQVCLPLYLLGGVLAVIVYMINARSTAGNVVLVGEDPATLWDGLVSYAGLILDGFLLPQVILNTSVSGSKVRAISPWFYMGGSAIRAAPHVYDVVRGRILEQLSVRLTKVYASPRVDLFGVAWDIVIPCGAALLATVLFLQQRLGDVSHS